MLFLVEGTMTYSPYMGRSKTKDVLRLVEAADESEACAKFEQHYSDMSIPNDDSYSANARDASAVIV